MDTTAIQATMTPTSGMNMAPPTPSPIIPEYQPNPYEKNINTNIFGQSSFDDGIIDYENDTDFWEE
jgi:hypothetical protein